MRRHPVFFGCIALTALGGLFASCAAGGDDVDATTGGGDPPACEGAANPAALAVSGATCGDPAAQTFTWTGGVADLEITTGALTGKPTVAGVASGHIETLPAGDYKWQVLSRSTAGCPAGAAVGPPFSITAPPSPDPIPAADLSEMPPITSPMWSGDLAWEPPAPAPSDGYTVEVYSTGCSSKPLSGFPATVDAGAKYAWTPPAPGKYKWRVMSNAHLTCPAGAWSDFRPIEVPATEMNPCPPTAPDPTFGANAGQVSYYLPKCTYDSVATDVHMDPSSLSGEFYTVGRYYNGSTRRGYVMKHDASGALVLNWGTSGVVELGTEATPNYVHTVIVDCAGTIHIGSRSDWNMRLIRLTSDGALDPSFGGGTGEVTESGLISAPLTDNGLMDMDSMGRYVQSATDWSGADGVAVLSRYTADGKLDLSFGNAGRLEIDFDATSQDVGGPVKVQDDDKIVMAGFTAADYPYVTTTLKSDLVIARATADGALDSTFGQGGIVKLDIAGTADMATNIAIQPDRKILVIGITNHTTSYQTPSQWVIVRLEADGALDTTFGKGGIVTLDPPFGGANDVNDWSRDVAVRSDGSIWVAGQWGWNSGAGRAVLARLTPTGELDACFGAGGWHSVPSWPKGFSQSDTFNGMTLQPDGALLLVAGINPSATGYAGLMRFKD